MEPLSGDSAVDTATADPSGGAPARVHPPWARSERLAAWTFGLYVAIALPVLVFGLGRYHWFLWDDWDFLARRTAGSPDDLLRPYAEHWSTIPILVFRAEWHLFGLRYRGYQVVVVAAHLTAATLLRVVMRRTGVGPWIATGAAGIFVLFSPGVQNVLWSFQIGMVGSLILGVLHLIAAGRDRSGPGRRDWVGLAAGLGALMCSGVGVVMVAAVGLSVLLRRGWRLAAFHTVPLAAIYLTWFAAYRGQQPKTPNSSPSILLSWMKSGFAGAVTGLGSGRLLGVVIVGVAAFGVGLLLEKGGLRALRRAADPFSLAAAALLFQLFTGNSRWAFGISGARAPRYIHVTVFLVLPLLALGFETLARQWRQMTPVLVLLLLVPIPGNIRGFDASRDVFSADYFQRQRTLVEAIAWSKEAAEVPRDSEPVRNGFGNEGPTVGWLVDARKAGDVPRPGPISPETAVELEIRLGVRQEFTSNDRSSSRVAENRACKNYSEPLVLNPKVGDSFIIKSDLGVRLRDASTQPLFPAAFRPFAGSKLTIELEGLRLRLQPVAPASTFRLCF